MKHNLEIGTKLLFTTNNAKSINTIVRETPTLWVTDKEYKIRKSDGSIYGNNSSKYNNYTTTFYRLLTDNDVQEIKDSNAKYKLVKKFRDFDFNKLDLETLKKLDELITKN